MGIPGTALPACPHPQGPSVCLSFQSSGLRSAQKAPPQHSIPRSRALCRGRSGPGQVGRAAVDAAPPRVEPGFPP